jgi:hypothetical protein
MMKRLYETGAEDSKPI